MAPDARGKVGTLIGRARQSADVGSSPQLRKRPARIDEAQVVEVLRHIARYQNAPVERHTVPGGAHDPRNFGRAPESVTSKPAHQFPV